MITISYFKNLQTTTPVHLTVDEVFAKIKNGNSRLLIDKIRAEKDKARRDKLKLSLPLITFSGKFDSRHNTGLIKHSGLIQMDFDKFPNSETLELFRAKIKSDKYTFACFTSPSGIGIKAIVKINIPSDNEEHNRYFEALYEYWKAKCKFTDENVKGTVRACYESFDPNLYINDNSETWSEISPKKEIVNFTPKLTDEIVSDEYETFKLLTTERECKSLQFTEGSRNAATYFLARRCNDYNININSALSFIGSYISGCGLPQNEIEATVKSAYKNTSDNKSYVKKTEHKEPVKAVASAVVKNKFEIFWFLTEKGTLKIDFYKIKKFLEHEGFFRYEMETSKFIFIQISNNVVKEVDLLHIKDYVLSYLETIDEIDVYNLIAEHSKFKKDYINFLEPKKITWCRDSLDTGYLFYQNCFVQITKSNIIVNDYSEINGSIWESQIIKRDFSLLKLDEFAECDAAKFSSFVCDNKEDRINAYITSLGYLMHTYKTYENARCIIYNDEVLSNTGQPMGRSGKGVTLKFIEQVRVVLELPGKSFNFDKSFSLQRLSQDTQVLFLNDVNKNFDFERLFNWITDGMTVEKKHAGEIFIPFEEAPKLAIATNYTVKGDGNSNDARRHELEIHPFFNPDNTPNKVFGRSLFTGWDISEWSKFDNFMAWALQLYLRNGLVKPEYINLKIKKLLNRTNEDFVSFAELEIHSGNRYNKKDLFLKFQNENTLDPFYKSKDFTPRRFNGWLKSYADYKSWYLDEDGTGNKFVSFKENINQECNNISDEPF